MFLVTHRQLYNQCLAPSNFRFIFAQARSPHWFRVAFRERRLSQFKLVAVCEYIFGFGLSVLIIMLVSFNFRDTSFLLYSILYIRFVAQNLMSLFFSIMSIQIQKLNVFLCGGCYIVVNRPIVVNVGLFQFEEKKTRYI